MSIPQRTALVTGGNRGLGAAIARFLHDAGHRVIITHTPGNSTIDQWQHAQAAQGYAFAAYGVDVSDYESAQELARRMYVDGYRIDILVNNAGITRDATLRKMDKVGWDAVMRTNLDSMFNVTKPFIDPMVERRAWLGSHHQRLVDQWQQGPVRADQLFGGQGRGPWLYQGAGAGSGSQGRNGQHRVARLSGHRDGDGRARGRTPEDR